jgi:putative membrane protein
MDQDTPLSADQIFAIERPESSLMTYYAWSSVLTGPAFPIVILVLYFRYHTMRYRFTEEGVSMRWGILFRKEINLTFARIQDIHLTSNFVERWLGLARIQIQTASGSAKAEMTIEGVPQYEALRDFLYARMRGAKGLSVATTSPPTSSAESTATPPTGGADGANELVATLREVTAELRAIRATIEARGGIERTPDRSSLDG